MRKIIIISFGVIALLAVSLFVLSYQQEGQHSLSNTRPDILYRTQNTYQAPTLDQSSKLSPSMQLINLPENNHILEFIEAHGGLSAMTNEQKNEVRTMLNIYKASIRK